MKTNDKKGDATPKKTSNKVPTIFSNPRRKEKWAWKRTEEGIIPIKQDNSASSDYILNGPNC